MLIIRLKSEIILKTQKTGDKVLKTTRRHNKVVKIYDNSLRCHLKSVDIKFKWHAVFGFQFALLTCFESDFDDAHECHPFMIIFHLWCQIFCPTDESLNVNESLSILICIIHFFSKLQTVSSVKIKNFIFMVGIIVFVIDCCYIDFQRAKKFVIKILRSNDEDDYDVESFEYIINLA
jgi:hypothetical protein